MAAHQLDDTVGTRNPHAPRWFCRCTIREDARSLAMPVCATASTRWPTDKAAADPPAAGVARQPGHGPDPDGRAAAAGGQPVPSGLTAAAVTNVPWRASSSCRPLAVSQTRTPITERDPALRGPASLPWPSCCGGGQAGGLAGGVPADAGPDGAGAGRDRGRGRLPARRTGTGSRLAVRAAGLLAAARGARQAGVRGCCPVVRGIGPGPAVAGRHHGRPAGYRGGPARIAGMAGPARRRVAIRLNGRPDCSDGHAKAPQSGNQQSPQTERPGETAGQSGGSGI